MTTVIDNLVLELGIDATKFSQGQREAVDALRKMQQQLEQGGKEVDSQGQKLDRFFSGLKREALTLGAAFFGGRGAKEFVQYITTVDAAAGRLSKTVNMSTRDISAWQNIFVQTGSSMEAANATLQSLTDDVNTFALTGNSKLLPIFNTLNISMKDGAGNLKTAGQLLMDINKAVQGMDPARARALLTMMGMDAGAVNVMVLSNAQLREMYDNQKKLSEITKEDAEAAQQLATAWHEAEAAATGWGRAMVTYLTPALTTFLNRWRDIFAELRQGHVISPNSWLGRTLGLKPIEADQMPKGYSAPPLVNLMDNAKLFGIERYIRDAAVKRGIDPDVAVAVAKSEGLNKNVVGPGMQSSVITRSGAREDSWGPFQLYMGGGLGNTFVKETGLDPRNPATIERQIDFALDKAKLGGWGPWHGWKGLPRAGLDVGPNTVAGGGGSSTVTNTTFIDKVEINTPSGDPQTIANDFKGAVDRANMAASANSGLK